MTPEQGIRPEPADVEVPEPSDEKSDAVVWSLNTPERQAALVERFTQELHKNPEGAARFPLPKEEKDAILADALRYYMRIGDIAPALTLLKAFEVSETVLRDEEIRRWATKERENFNAYPAEAEEITNAFRLPDDRLAS